MRFVVCAGSVLHPVLEEEVIRKDIHIIAEITVFMEK